MTRASVCMATFNGMKFVREQVDSILAQLGADDELIVADDASDDGTPDIVAALGDPRIRLLRNGFRNITRNFESALGEARGDFIFLSDQDDIWLDGKVQITLNLLAGHQLVLSDCLVVGESGEVLQPSYFDALGSASGLLRNFWRNSYLGCCMAFRRSLLKVALPIPNGVAHDYWIGMVAELTDRPYFLDRPLVAYRRHGSTASFAARRSGRTLIERLVSRAVLAGRLAVRAIDLKLRRFELEGQ